MSAASRPTVVYVIMLACSIVGLWVILTFGRDLKPAPNLSGQWQLTPATSASQNTGSTMQVEQSGRFIQIAFENAKPFGMQMTDSCSPARIALDGGKVTMEFSGLDKTDAVQLVVNALDKAHNGIWMIHRIQQPAPAVRGAH